MVWLVVLKIRNWNLTLNLLLGFEVVAQCAERLVECWGSFALDLDMKKLAHMYRDQIPKMDHPLI
jgi:hypothetical protein